MAVERVHVDEAGSPWKEEHAARYVWASRFTEGGEVLDIACGTGFGSEILLGSGASRVVAADVAEDAVEQARERLSGYGDRVQVRREDGGDLSFPDQSFDAVVSMETVEHVEDAERYLSEIHRVLRPGGKLLLSTPNALVTNPGGGAPENPFHVREFTPDELQALLEPRFEIELAVGQHLPPEYGVAPFLPSFRRDALKLPGKVNFFYWRVLLRVKIARDPVHRLLTGYSFFPGEDDYTFLPDNLERAHVQLWVCVRREQGR